MLNGKVAGETLSDYLCYPLKWYGSRLANKIGISFLAVE